MRLSDLKKAVALLQAGGNAEAEHGVGELGEPAFQSSYTPLGASPARFYKDHGRVYLAGAANHIAGAADGDVVFTLPEGYRPPHTVLVPARILDVTTGLYRDNALLFVLASGDVMFNGLGNDPFANPVRIYLDGVDFRVA